MNPKDKSNWSDEANIYDFDEVPTGRDLLLIGSDQLEVFQQSWKQFLANPPSLANPHVTTPDPDELLRMWWCAIETHGAESHDVNICITMMTRYHPAVRKLPRSKFVVCVHFSNWQKRPYVVVEQDWFDEIQRSLCSLFALVDAIGMRGLLEKQGKVNHQQVAALQHGLDELAEKYPDHAFFSFADNVILKTNWSADAKYNATYRPERFLHVIREVRDVLMSALKLNSYAVVSQGANLLADNTLVRISRGQNHVFLGSLGTPFVQLFEIDTAIRQAIRDGVHEPKELYLASWFFITLQYRSFETKDELAKRLVPFSSKVSTSDECSYLPIDVRELFPLLKPQDDARSANEH